MNYREQWQEQGYLIVPGVFDQKQVADLFEVCEAAYEQWKEESTDDSEPGGYGYGPVAWALIHLNHPKYHQKNSESLRTLLNAVANPLAMQITRDIFKEEPMFMQSNYYIDPPGGTRPPTWHRDSQFFSNKDEEVEKRDIMEQADPPRELHMHIPLIATAASELVPGSHRRWDTPEENRIRTQDSVSNEMPGAVRLNLQPGDMAFFHVNTLHRGLYTHGVPRRTIAVTFSRESLLRKPTAELMAATRGYYSTYQPWLLKPGYLDGVSPSARALFERFIEGYGESWKPEYAVPELGPKLQSYFTDF